HRTAHRSRDRPTATAAHRGRSAISSDRQSGLCGRGEQPPKGRGMNDTAVLLCGHGSRDPDAIGEFEVAAAASRRRLASPDFATGYLEFARPTIQQGLADLAARGARRILAVPGMLFAASHVKNDLPWEMNSFMAANPGIEVRLGRHLAIDPKLLAAAAERIAAAAPEERQDAVPVVAGPGP